MKTCNFCRNILQITSCCLKLFIFLTRKIIFFIFFSRITGPISIILGTMHHWLKGIQVCSNEGPSPFPRGENYEITKIHCQNLKIFFWRTTGPISTKLSTKHPWVKDSNLFKRKAPSFPKKR